MKQSQLFTKTLKEAPKDEQSINAQLLERGGFIYKNSAGVYSFLPLGWRVIEKIAVIIREEMNAISAQEMFMPTLVEKKYLDATKRWDVEVGFKLKDQNFVLGWTHEEVLTEIVSKFVSSYKDLPFYAYQIQTKFRNEPRAKSGILRTREFIMKDLYSFHTTEKDLLAYYEKVKQAYFKIFERCGLKTIYTVAAGGAFTKSNTHEFQVLSEVGEDTIYVCEKCQYAENAEISKLKSGDKCPQCGGKIEEKKSIEVGNIFPLGTKYSETFNLQYLDENGKKHYVVMGSYGIGLGRVMGAIVEVYHDGKGILWPETVAPFHVHLLDLNKNSPRPSLSKRGVGGEFSADKVYQTLQKEGIEVLYDERDGSAGVKFADADLIGIPYRVVVSGQTEKENKIEVKARNEDKAKLVDLKELIATLIRKFS